GEPVHQLGQADRVGAGAGLGDVGVAVADVDPDPPGVALGDVLVGCGVLGYLLGGHVAVGAIPDVRDAADACGGGVVRLPARAIAERRGASVEVERVDGRQVLDNDLAGYPLDVHGLPDVASGVTRLDLDAERGVVGRHCRVLPGWLAPT